MKTASKKTILASLLIVAGAWMMSSCSGDNGKDGANGAAGQNCAVAQTATGATITCPGQEPVVISNGASGAAGAPGAQGPAGQGSCHAEDFQQGGVDGVRLTCGDQVTFIPKGGSGSGSTSDCKLAPNAAGTQFVLTCGTGATATTAAIAFCQDANDPSKPVLVYNPKTQKCNAGAIVPGTAKCAGVEYVMTEKFCQLTGTNSDADDHPDGSTTPGTELLFRCGITADGYDDQHFCHGLVKEDPSLNVNTQSVQPLCALTSTNKVTFKIDEFCKAVFNATTKEIVKRCGFVSSITDDSLGIKVDQGNSVYTYGEYNVDQFCQAKKEGGYRIQDLCGYSTVAGSLYKGDEYKDGGLCYAGELTEKCGAAQVDYKSRYSFCVEATSTTYGKCGIYKLKADGSLDLDGNNNKQENGTTGVYDPTAKKFCYSEEYAEPSNYADANDYGVITDVCDMKYVSANNATALAAVQPNAAAINFNDPVVTAAATETAGQGKTWKILTNVGYRTTEFCANVTSGDNAGKKVVYKKCEGQTKVYDVNLRECIDDLVQGRCGNGYFAEAAQACIDNTVRGLCDGLAYTDLDKNACINGTVTDCTAMNPAKSPNSTNTACE